MLRSWLASRFDRTTIKADLVAGSVLGFETVPAGLAGGLLAGVNPVYGLYGCMVGTFAGGLLTSSAFMAVQSTGAMAIIVADVPSVHQGSDPRVALFTLAVLTGVVMIVAGLLGLASLLRWVSNAVMVGFISAVGVNIVLGQLDDFTGYTSEGSNRITRAIDTLLGLREWMWVSVLVGVVTIVLIVVLEKTRLGPLGLVVAIYATSIPVSVFGVEGVQKLHDIVDVPGLLPAPVMPDPGLLPRLLVPALALGFVGLVQGAAVSASLPNPDGTFANASADFVGQGASNVAAGVFQGMPVGGSMSASTLIHEAGAKSKSAMVIAGVVMAVTILALGDLVGHTAMPALAGLLMIVGYRTVSPHDLRAVWLTGRVPAAVMVVTFTLTMLIPIQNAVLVGIGISVILYVVSESNRITVRRLFIDDRGMREGDAPAEIGEDEVMILEPYGSLFFASAAGFEEALPAVVPSTRNAVLILRLRSYDDLGSTYMGVLERLAEALLTSESKLKIVYSDPNVRHQLRASRLVELIGDENLYRSSPWRGETVRVAYEDALTWMREGTGD